MAASHVCYKSEIKAVIFAFDVGFKTWIWRKHVWHIWRGNGETWDKCWDVSNDQNQKWEFMLYDESVCGGGVSRLNILLREKALCLFF